MVFGDNKSNSVIQIYPGLFLIATATKFGTKWAITRLLLEISARCQITGIQRGWNVQGEREKNFSYSSWDTLYEY